eukprot:364453-Prymnesium_polylepis.1
MAPLPMPPDQSRVPAWATHWRYALRPWYYSCMRRWHHYAIASGTSQGAPHVPQVAFGSWGFEPWAAAIVDDGEVLVRRDGHLMIMDCSLTPDPHWGRP